MSIGSRIKESRCAIGWSQVRLADEAGVTQSSIGNIESGSLNGAALSGLMPSSVL
ncbi:helix-turn-helix protein [compost metagenome]